jgi:hypothetical protein
MQTDTISPTPTVDHLKPWLAAAYGRVGSLTSPYRNIVFTPEAEGRVMQIAGWLVGLTHAGKRAEAEQIAEDINANLAYLNGYGGMMETEFEDGSPVPNVPRYMVRLGDDGTFGGFTVAWYRAIRDGSAQDGDRGGMLRDQWGSLVDHCRWGAESSAPREFVRHIYKFDMSGGLLYHGPGGGETFSVNVGTPRFWSIHT